MKKAKRTIEYRWNGDAYTVLTDSILEELEFSDNGKCSFQYFEHMSYWVKNSICLFYNVPPSVGYQDSYYIGYAEMRQGRYVAVAFRWIDSLEELTEIYESITHKSIIEPI